MAWSDAARAAALEARRIHSQARRSLEPLSYVPNRSSFWQGSVTKSYRQKLARAVRAFHSGKAESYKGPWRGFDQGTVMHRAAQSTQVRNSIYGGATALKALRAGGRRF